MSRKTNPFDPMGWMTFTLRQQFLALSAAETIARRMTMMGNGTMSGVETVSMLFEKPAAFAKGMERAAVASAKGRTPVEIMDEFMKPMTVSAGANAKRLRK